MTRWRLSCGTKAKRLMSGKARMPAAPKENYALVVMKELLGLTGSKQSSRGCNKGGVEKERKEGVGLCGIGCRVFLAVTASAWPCGAPVEC